MLVDLDEQIQMRKTPTYEGERIYIGSVNALFKLTLLAPLINPFICLSQLVGTEDIFLKTFSPGSLPAGRLFPTVTHNKTAVTILQSSPCQSPRGGWLGKLSSTLGDFTVASGLGGYYTHHTPENQGTAWEGDFELVLSLGWLKLFDSGKTTTSKWTSGLPCA